MLSHWEAIKTSGMYACNNCKTPVAQAEGRCTGCNIRLNPGRVHQIQMQDSSAPIGRPDTSLEVSHRCVNCGEVLFNAGGKCRSCRFPIPGVQINMAPEAEIIPLHLRRSHDLRNAQ